MKTRLEASPAVFFPGSKEEVIFGSFTDAVRRQGVDCLIADGASIRAAEYAIEEIMVDAAHYIAVGPFKATPDKIVKAKLGRLARDAEKFRRSLYDLDEASGARLYVFLRQRSDAAARLADQGTGIELLSATERFDRVLNDVSQLAPLLQTAANFKSKLGRPENRHVRRLFEASIYCWAHAAGQAPTASQVDGHVNSPLLFFLRALVYPVAEHEEVREALTDDIYLAVLKAMKRRKTGLPQRPVIAERRASRRHASGEK